MKRVHVNAVMAAMLVVSGTMATVGAGHNESDGVREGASLASGATSSDVRVAAHGGTPFATAEENARARELVTGMTLAQKAGQVIVATYAGHGSPAELIRRLHLGGAVPVSDNIRSVAQIRNVVRSVRQAVAPRGYPAFIGIDQEGGRVTRIANGAPSLMAAGAARKPALTARLHRSLGLEMRGLGFTAVLAPVADLTIGRSDPTIGTRSASAWPSVAGGQVTAAARGLVESGVVPTLKHFPGHGSVRTDTHIDLAVQRRSLAQLRAKDLVPFQRAIAAGAPAVMTGHIDVRAVAPGIPASLSWKVTTGLLRRQMGFRGLVVTDSLGMGAITRRFASAESSVRALIAGADVVLMPPNAAAARRGIVQAVRSGRLPNARLEQAATRMIATMLHQESVRPSGARMGTARGLSIEMARAGLTQVSGRCTGRVVGRTVRVTGPRARAFASIARSEGLRVGSSGPLIALFMTRPPVTAHVAVALDRPHLLGSAMAPYRFATYDDSGPSMRAVVRRLLGKTAAPGRLPTGAGSVPRSGC